MSGRRAVIAAALGALSLGFALDAQVTLPPNARGQAQRGQKQNLTAQPAPPANRAALERQLRQALARVTRRQLGLDNAKMAQLMRVDQKFERQRRSLAQRQRQTRLALRAAMADSSSDAQTTIAQQLDTLLSLERQRIDMLEAEQKELANFLTPLQRAKYQALQERVRRRLEELRIGAPLPDSALGIRPQRPRR
jgi:hypothetical protein